MEPPPPCPVDDTPFTACTPESVALARAQTQAAAQGQTLPTGTILAIPVARPSTLPAPVAQPSTVIGPTVTTKTYRGRPGTLRDGRHRLPK